VGKAPVRAALFSPAEGTADKIAGSRNGSSSEASLPVLLVNRSAGLAMESARCSRVVLYCSTQASTAAWAAGRSANRTASSSSSRRRLPWNRSILPVVVDLAGAGSAGG
jgi:hypothetical protein